MIGTLVCRLPLDTINVNTCPFDCDARVTLEWLMKRMHGASQVRSPVSEKAYSTPYDGSALHVGWILPSY